MIESIPLPPDELMQAVVGHADRGAFERSRIAGSKRILQYLKEAGVDPEQFEDVLDFGCGCGRIISGWVLDGARFRLSGVDIDPEAVAWCRENIPGVQFAVTTLTPPLDAADGAFDFVYAISVFTHLDLAHQRAWVEELWRVLRPGGALFVTFHGHLYHKIFFERAVDGKTRFEKHRHLALNEEHQGTRCATLHDPGFLAEVFRPFSPLLHVEGPCHVAGRQDAYVFRKAPSG